jgi:hypothetical protein
VRIPYVTPIIQSVAVFVAIIPAGPTSCRSSFLRSYASLECDAFPQITQIAACCTCGTHRIPWTCTIGVVAADSKRAVFQQLQGYIITLLKSLSSSDKVLLSRQSIEHTTILSFPFEKHRQAISSFSTCPIDGRAFFFNSDCS